MWKNAEKIKVENSEIGDRPLPHFRPKINKQGFIELCKICLPQMYFRVEDLYFKQKDGLFICSPFSPPFSELCLQKLEREYIFLKPETPKLWLWKVDDTFVVTKQDPQIMFSELNNVLPHVNFTFESMINNQMPFLDCLVIREGNKLEAKPNAHWSIHSLHLWCSTKQKGISNFSIDKEGKISVYHKWLFGRRTLIHKKPMMLNGYPKAFI